jgi:hypothetical protein
MKHTLLYLKVIILVLLFAIMLAGFACGILLTLTGFFTALYTHDVAPLLCVPVGLFSGFIGFTTLDIIEYINDNWSWKL